MQRSSVFLVALLLCSFTPAFAQESDPSSPTETGPKENSQADEIENEDMRREYNDSFGKEDREPEDLPEYVAGNSREARELSNIGIFGTYTPFGLLVSGRAGVEVDWILSEGWTLKGEYGSASYSASRYSFDIASFTETVYGIHARYYPGNSFNLSFGLGRRTHELKLGSDLVAGGSKKVSVETNVVHFGLGNRWQWNNGFSIGADWVIFDIPFGDADIDDKDVTDEIDNEDDREDVKDVISAMRYFPTIGVARLGIGFVF